MVVRQARIARARKRSHGGEILARFRLIDRLNFVIRSVHRTIRYKLGVSFYFTSEAFTFVGNAALQFFFSSHTLFEMQRLFDGF